MRTLARHSFAWNDELTLLWYRRKIDVLPAPADPSTIALSRIGAPLPFLEPYGAAAVPTFIIGTSCACWYSILLWFGLEQKGFFGHKT